MFLSSSVDAAQPAQVMSDTMEARVDLEENVTPLMKAARAGLAQDVRQLIAEGSDVNDKTSSGFTTLMCACGGGSEEAVQLLLKVGANVEDEDCDGFTSLMEAAYQGHCGVAR